MATSPELIRKQEGEGRALLQMKPIDKEVYAAWSDATREIVGQIFGAASQHFKDFLGARRTISVRFDNDPSYYLTQLGANLRRELGVLKKCLDAVEAEGRPAPARASPPVQPVSAPKPVGARPAVSAAEKATAKPAEKSTAKPAEKSTAKPAESRVKILVVAEEEEAAQMLLAALEWGNAMPVPLWPGFEDVRGAAERRTEDGEEVCAVVALAAGEAPRKGKSEKSGSPLSQEMAFTLGVLVGALGAGRVCAVSPQGAPPLPPDCGIHAVSLQDPDGWRAKIFERFREAGVPLAQHRR